MKSLKHYVLIFICAGLVSGGHQFMSESTEMASSSDPNAARDAVDSQGNMTDDYFNSLFDNNVVQTIQKFNIPNHQATQECDGKWPCTKPLPDARYETCNSKNDYLEDGLNQARDKYSIIRQLTPAFESDSSRQNQIIPRQCFREAMNSDFYSIKNKDSFKSCENPSGSPSRAMRPCVSNNYFNAISNGFNLVSQCLGGYVLPGASQSAKNKTVYSIFKMINLESGFHMNVMSATGSGGLGQLTPGAIQDVGSPTVQKQLIAHLTADRASDNCRLMAEELLIDQPPMKSGSKQSCERIDPSHGNPLLNLIYTFGYFKMARNSVAKVLNEKNFSKFVNLNPDDKEQLISSIATWAHNTGPSGITTPLIGLLNEYIMRGEKVTNVKKFLAELETAASQMPHRANSSASRRAETSVYYRKMQSATAQLEGRLGVSSCLQE